MRADSGIARTLAKPDNYLAVGIHTGQDLVVEVAQVDLGPQRAALHIEPQRRSAPDVGRNPFIAVALGSACACGTGFHIVGIPFGNIDKDANDVGAIHDINRCGLCTGCEAGRILSAEGSPEAGRTKSQSSALRTTITPS